MVGGVTFHCMLARIMKPTQIISIKALIYVPGEGFLASILILDATIRTHTITRVVFWLTRDQIGYPMSTL
jgi:hypothetical protein